MTYEGVIKFNFSCADNQYLIPQAAYNLLNPVRQLLKNKNYMGVYPDGISYGNISLRNGSGNTFFITASDTGKLKNTYREHYVEVIYCDTEKSQCLYKGPGLPSSESLSHFIIYSQCSEINAVIHIHDSSLWKSLYGRVPTSKPDVTYGSREMVREIERLLRHGPLMHDKIMVMGGHPDGIICFGNSIAEAVGVLNTFSEYH